MVYLVYLVNGVSYGMLLFIIAAGLTMVMGTMGILNCAHGAFYLLGVYIAYSVAGYTNNFLFGLLAASVSMGLVGMLVQYGLLARIPKLPSQQFLLTFGIVYMISEGTKMVWGTIPLVPSKPDLFSGSIPMGDFALPTYRLVIIGAGILTAILLWLFLEKTKWGAVLRAGNDDAEMAEGIGINIPYIWVLLFGLGALLTGWAASLGGPYLPATRGQDWLVLMMVFVVIIVGGVGSLKGAFVASLVIGILDNVGRMLFPVLAIFFIFLLMVIVLLIRPAGLFGKA